jgi:hypothetical protein
VNFKYSAENKTKLPGKTEIIMILISLPFSVDVKHRNKKVNISTVKGCKTCDI